MNNFISPASLLNKWFRPRNDSLYLTKLYSLITKGLPVQPSLSDVIRQGSFKRNLKPQNVKNYQINMKILGAHLYIVSNECKKIRKTHAPFFLEHGWTKSCPQTRNRRQTRWAQHPPPHFITTGIMITYTAMMCTFVWKFSGF